MSNPAIGGPSADPDGDGLSNLQEWAQGSDPTNPGKSSVSSAVETHTDGQPYLTISYRRNLGATGLNAFADSSAGLGTWSLNTGAAVGSPVNNGDGTETVKFRDTVPANGGSGASRFMRLRFTAP